MWKKIFILFNIFVLSNQLTMLGSRNEKITCSLKNTYNATTKGIQEIFIGRCNYFLYVLQKKNCDIDPANYNCSTIWAEFFKSIVGKEPCSLKVEDFNKFLSLVSHPIPENKTLFWSGTYTTAHQYTKVYEYWTLEDTFSGYLLNELTFCSLTNRTTLSYESCPTQCVYSNNMFWNAASIDFARRARGEANVFLNGSRSAGAIAPWSTFKNYELPQFNSSNINKLNVFLLKTPNMTQYETCGNGTLLQLKNTLANRSIALSCTDNSKAIFAYICFENPDSKECSFLNNVLINGSFKLNPNSFNLIVFLIFIIKFNK